MPGRDNGNWWWECKLVNIFKRKLTAKKSRHSSGSL